MDSHHKINDTLLTDFFLSTIKNIYCTFLWVCALSAVKIQYSGLLLTQASQYAQELFHLVNI